MRTPINTVPGPHSCKSHDYAHPYAQHTCGHEFCPLSWDVCPRCHGSEADNMLPGHPDYLEATSPTAIELAFVSQGYSLPEGWSWARVHATRAHYRIEEIFVPVASASGVCAWGVPMIAGHALAWKL